MFGIGWESIADQGNMLSQGTVGRVDGVSQHPSRLHFHTRFINARTVEGSTEGQRRHYTLLVKGFIILCFVIFSSQLMLYIAQ